MASRARRLLSRWYNTPPRTLFVKLLLLLLIPNLLLVFVIQQLMERQTEQKINEIRNMLVGLEHAANREIGALFGVVTTLTNQLIIEPDVQDILVSEWLERHAPAPDGSSTEELRKLQRLYDNQAVMQSLLSRYRLVWENIYSLAVIDTRRNIYMSTAQNYRIDPEDLQRSRLLETESDAQLAWSTNDALTKNENMITISRKIYGTTMPQQVIGYVVINMSLNEIRSSFDTYNYFGNMMFGLFDESGNGRMMYDGVQFAAVEPGSAFPVTAPMAEWSDVDYGGASWKVVVRKVETANSDNDGNYLFVGLDNAYIAAQTKAANGSLLYGYAIFLVLALGISLQGARLLSRKIGRVLKAMRQFGQEQWGTRIQLKGSDEISLIGDTFNAMATRIEDLLREVKSEQQLKRLFELRVMEYQINPHFLYNTLDTLHWLALDSDQPKISRMVDGLSKLFRIILSKGRETISLREEFEMVRIYLDIHKIRLEDRFDYEIRLSPEAAEQPIGKLVLQPLVENALMHGIRRLRSKGVITVTGEMADGEVVLEVADNGVGMTAEQLDRQRELLDSELWEEDMQKGAGYGMKNVDSRLKLMFGERYRMEVKSDGEMTGTRVIIRLRMDDKSGGAV